LAHATVNGNGTAGGGINLNGSSTIVGTSSPNASVSIPTVPTTVSAPIAIPTTYNTLTAASAILGGLSQSVGANTVTNGASLTLSDSNVGLDVFTLNTSQFSGSLKDFTINAPTGATVVVDINGSGPVSWTSSGFNLSGGITTSKVLLDFTSTQSIVLSGIGILGSVLAPDATITGSDGQFDGTVIAANLVGSMEFDAPGNFNGDLSSVSNISAVPLPAALPMFGFALAGLSGIGLRSRRRA
jgi:choice-of-anchor A domain-containing protein